MIGASVWGRRLGAFGPLATEDRDLLGKLTESPTRYLSDRQVTNQGELCKQLHVMVEGVGCRYMTLPNGRRQILSYVFAGDMTNPQRLLLGQRNESFCTLVASRIAVLDLRAVQELDSRQAIRAAMTKYALERQAIADEWLVNVGIRSAMARLCHMLCEIYLRLKDIGLTDQRTFRLQLTQAQLADALALSNVHVNRTFMELRRRKIIEVRRGVIAILDAESLVEAGDFDAGYLTRLNPGAPWSSEPARRLPLLDELQEAIPAWAGGSRRGN